MFDTRKQAAKALKRLKGDFPGAKVVKVSAGGGSLAGRRGRAVGQEEGGHRRQASSSRTCRSSRPDEYQKKSRKLPDTTKLPGKAPPKDNKKPGGGDGTAAIDDRMSTAAAAERSTRARLAERLAELQWDLGGLAYEMAIRDHFRLDVLVRGRRELQRVDAELGEVERLLRLERGRRGRANARLRRAARPRRRLLLAVRHAQLLERRRDPVRGQCTSPARLVRLAR